jgi:hypothetical protein
MWRKKRRHRPQDTERGEEEGHSWIEFITFDN